MEDYVWADPRYAPFFERARRIIRQWKFGVRYGLGPTRGPDNALARLIEAAVTTAPESAGSGDASQGGPQHS